MSKTPQRKGSENAGAGLSSQSSVPAQFCRDCISLGVSSSRLLFVTWPFSTWARTEGGYIAQVSRGAQSPELTPKKRSESAIYHEHTKSGSWGLASVPWLWPKPGTRLYI